MRDRGTLIAGAGIALAFLLAGVASVFFARRDAQMQHADEAHAAADAEIQQVQAMQAWKQQPFQVIGVDQAPDAAAAGADWLAKKQSGDGAWRSDSYATFKNGTALTPLAVVALQAASPKGQRDAVDRGCDWLAGRMKPDGDIDYPVYTAALAVIALSHPDQKQHVKARDAWLKFLLSHQLTEANGWKPEDKQFGGWGYCRLVPKKPEKGAISPPLVESNLSATVFALEALKAAGVADKDELRNALVFIERCQNPDGGFHFIDDDPVRNKAGGDAAGFRSYGSATADGLRALRLADSADEFRIGLARNWLKHNFRADKHPGDYIPAHEKGRDAVWYYYAASVSKVLRTEDMKGLPHLVLELVARRQPDGSWANPLTMVREDEPIVATCHALIALSK